jgi:imidazolonepropionase
MSQEAQKAKECIDAESRLVFPSFCDSHTHIVYAGSREIEYIDKIKGLSYEEIAKRGGGILNSAKRLHQTSEMSFSMRLGNVWKRKKPMVPCRRNKSGYGLATED